jgi:hypothetical protein
MEDPPENRRDSGRFEASFECSCAGIRQKGSGILEDISRSGALIEKTLLTPDPGELVGLHLDVAGVGSVVLIGRMVRRTFTGFALEFDQLDDRAAALVDNLAAVVQRRRPRSGA